MLLHRNPTEVRLVIEDDGKGFDAPSGAFRAAAGAGGHAGTRPPGRRLDDRGVLSRVNGTTVCIRVPLPGRLDPERVMSIRVFIVDDHGILRGGLRALINPQPDMEVVGEAANGPDAELGVRETVPDLVLMDISMPNGGGLAAIAAIKQVRPKTRMWS